MLNKNLIPYEEREGARNYECTFPYNKKQENVMQSYTIKSPKAVGKILLKKSFPKATVCVVLSKNQKELVTLSKRKDSKKEECWQIEKIKPLRTALDNFVKREHLELSYATVVKIEQIIKAADLQEIEQRAKYSTEWLIILYTIYLIIFK